MKFIPFLILVINLNFSLEAQIQEVKITDNWDNYKEVKKFYDADDNEVDSLKADYYCIEKRENGKYPRGVRFFYSMDEILEFVDCYSNLDSEELHGTSQDYNEEEILISIYTYKHNLLSGPFNEFHEDGMLKYQGKYRNGQLTDTLKTFYPDGNMRRMDIYLDGKLTLGNCYTNFGADTTYFPFWSDAVYPDGSAGLQKYIQSNVRYPEDAMDMNEMGKVEISFVVEENGSITNVEVIKSVSQSLDQEAMRIVREMPNWEPSREDGYLGRTRCQIPIVFTLVDSKKEKKRKTGK